MQEAILLLGAATSPVELRLAVTNALHTALPDVVCGCKVAVYTLLSIFYPTQTIML